MDAPLHIIPLLPQDIVSHKLMILSDMQSASRLGRTSHYYHKSFEDFLCSKSSRNWGNYRCGCQSVRCGYLDFRDDACTKALVFYAKEHISDPSNEKAANTFMHLFHLMGRYRIGAIENIIPNFSRRWDDIIAIYAGKYDAPEIKLLNDPKMSSAIERDLIAKNSQLLLRFLKNKCERSIKTLLLADNLLFDVHYVKNRDQKGKTLLDYALSYEDDPSMFERILQAAKGKYSIYGLAQSIIRCEKIGLLAQFLTKDIVFSHFQKISLCIQALKKREKAYEKFKIFEKLIESFFPEVINEEKLLYHAIKADNVLAVRYLLQHGADVNACFEENRTPLIVAVAYNKYDPSDNVRPRHVEIAQLLLDYGADATLVDIEEKSVLHHSIIWQQHVYNSCMGKIIQQFIKKGADINAEDEWGHTAYYYACKVWGKDRGITQILKPQPVIIESIEFPKEDNDQVLEVSSEEKNIHEIKLENQPADDPTDWTVTEKKIEGFRNRLMPRFMKEYSVQLCGCLCLSFIAGYFLAKNNYCRSY